MAVFHAEALTDVGDFRGNCLISVSGQALSLLHPSEHSLIAKWQYSGIRKFKADVNTFIFESGRKGPYGVGEYMFELPPGELQQLQSTVTQFTGASFHTKTPRATAEPVAMETSTVEEPVRKESESDCYSVSNPEESLEAVRELALVDEGVAEGDEGEGRSRGRVYAELLDTEQSYVADLQMVINSYYDAMDPDSVTIPLRLRGKRHVVFGNLLDIYTFHEKVFSCALGFFDKCPERVGLCFMQFSSEFELYSSYCKNRPRSEVLVNEGTESQAFFKGIQRNLGHQFDLSSYLHKPVQRITKYQLLLKDLLKHSGGMAGATEGLEAAYKQMCKILQELNDSMHTAGLKGLPDDLPEPGKLLAHDRFQVSVLEPGPLTFSRSREKHVFLFEKLIVLSKKVEASEGAAKRARKNEAYLYKEHLEMTNVTLRESVSENPLVFALSLHKQQREHRFEAQSHEVQEMWVNEIRRLLQLQFTRLKMKREKTGDGCDTPTLTKKVIDIDTSLRMSSSCDCLASTAPDTPTPTPMFRRSAVLTEKPAGKKAVKTSLSNPPIEPPASEMSISCHPNGQSESPTPPSNHPSREQTHRKSSSVSLKVSCDQERQQRKNPPVPPPKVLYDQARQQRKSSLPSALDRNTNRGNLMNGRSQNAPMSRGGMAVDNSVCEAVEKVRSNQPADLAWCVCGYRDNNHKEPLVVCGEGCGSLDGMKQHLHDDNISFGFLKVVEVVDTIPRNRFVYVQWIGERSRPMAKAKTTTHRTQIVELFQPYNVAIVASSRADVTERVVMDKVTSITGTKNHVL